MPKQIQITAPWPTSEEMARHLRISKRRQKELNAMAEKFFERSRAKEKAARSTAIESGKSRKRASAA